MKQEISDKGTLLFQSNKGRKNAEKKEDRKTTNKKQAYTSNQPNYNCTS